MHVHSENSLIIITVELYLFILIGMVSYPGMWKIQIIRFFFDNRHLCSLKFVIIYSMYLHLNLLTMPDLKF